MHFNNPRAESGPLARTTQGRTTSQPDELTKLHLMCRDGRLYDVERWIADGQPLQAARQGYSGRAASALQIALQAGNHSLMLLLLSNGYDANQEFDSPLNLALRARRFDLVALLLDWGADPHRVDLDDLFGTYNSELFERFHGLGVDLVAGHAIAETLAYHTSNKPLLGFAKRRRLTDSRFQTELDIALAHHAAEGHEKGVQLCRWAGANPHTPVWSLRFGVTQEPGDGSDDDDGFSVSSAIYEACQAGHDEILRLLGPDPKLDDFEELWRVAGSAAAIDTLAQHCLPENVGAVVQHHLWWATFSEGFRRLDTIRRLFEAGVRWKEASIAEIGALRRSLLKASESTFVELIKLLATDDYCSSDILRELARTPSMVARLKQVGFLRSHDERQRYQQLRPTQSGDVQRKLGIQVPKPRQPNAGPPPVPRSVGIGHSHEGETRIDREQLFELVWSKPVATVAAEFGLSGPGLKKRCRRLAIPVPPRGYWAKLSAGKPVNVPRLPALPT